MMRPQGLRRLAADIGALHHEPLPPNYLFDPNHVDDDELTQLDVLLAGPSDTPFSEGVWKLHLSIPDDYPQQPPTANFRTSIFHPNVHPETGGVCVETLKRDWDQNLTLRDVLVTISCLLIQPNPDSALNAEAGSLLQEDYAMFARRARLMTSIHALVPAHLASSVREAQCRGQQQHHVADVAGPVRQRRPMANPRRHVRTRISGQSPTVRAKHREPARFKHDEHDDVFQTPQKLATEDTMDEDDQENRSESPTSTPFVAASTSTPRRPDGPPVPLAELRFESSDEDMEPEYPPSPKKSPTKSPVKRALFSEAVNNHNRLQYQTPSFLTETDASIHIDTPGVPFQPIAQPVFQPSNENDYDGMTVDDEGVSDELLWTLCGRDTERWNRCDFDEQPFAMIATRW